MKKIVHTLLISLFVGLCIYMILYLFFDTIAVTSNIEDTENLEKKLEHYITLFNEDNDVFSVKAYEYKRGEIIIAKAPYTAIDLKVYNDVDNPKGIRDWFYAIDKKPVLLVNGGYFNEEFKSTGGLIVNYEKSGVLTNDGQNGYTGMIYSDDSGIHINYLVDNNLKTPENIQYGVQSYPMLIKPGGWIGDVKKSEKVATRTFVGMTKHDEVFVGVTHNFSMSLYDLAHFLYENTDLNVDRAFNLDGGPSSGFILNNNNELFIQNSALVPNVIGFYERK